MSRILDKRTATIFANTQLDDAERFFVCEERVEDGSIFERALEMYVWKMTAYRNTLSDDDEKQANFPLFDERKYYLTEDGILLSVGDDEELSEQAIRSFYQDCLRSDESQSSNRINFVSMSTAFNKAQGNFTIRS